MYFIGDQQKKLNVVLGQNLDQIRSNVVKKTKETSIIISFFSYFRPQSINCLVRISFLLKSRVGRCAAVKKFGFFE